MMKYAVRYYSKSGNTEKLADVAGSVLGVSALDITHPLDEDVDVLFFGSGVYGNALEPAVVKFFDDVDVNVGMLVNFCSAGIMESNYILMGDVLARCGIRLSSDEFHCPGSFVGMNMGRPNDNDLNDFRKFVESFLS